MNCLLRTFTLAGGLSASLIASVALAQSLKPGDIDPTFGANGFRRIPIDAPGESAFDSARFVKIRSEVTPGFPVAFRYIYVVGIAGGRFAIAKLDANGNPVASFGTNGRVLSTQNGMNSVAGFEFAPNGDLVVGYSVANGTNLIAGAPDYFIEVFTRDGVPRIQQTVVFPFAQEVNWVGVNICDGQTNGLAVDDLVASTMAKTPSGNIAVIGRARMTGDPPYRYHALAMASLLWNGATSRYSVNPGSLQYLCGGGAGSLMTTARIAPGYVASNRFVPNAAFFGTDTNLFMAGTLQHGTTASALNLGPAYGTLQHFYDSYVHEDGSAWIYNSAYWGQEARQTTITSMQWEPARPMLNLYGSAELEFFANGNRNAPIVIEGDGTSVMSPRWLFLNPLLSTRSVDTQKGLRWNDRHIVVGALRPCSSGDQCSGQQNSFFVAMSGGPANTLSFPPFLPFGFQGSNQYFVKSYNGIDDAPRAWALDAAVLEPSVDGTQHLIVVGDFHSASVANPADYDWFVTRIRLRGAPGNIEVSRAGSGAGTVTSNPAGINCSPTCSAAFDPDLEVLLTATPQAGSVFAGWSAASDCISTFGTTCRVHVDGTQLVGAVFDLGNDRIFRNGFDSTNP